MTRSLWMGLGSCLLAACSSPGNAALTTSGSGMSGMTSTASTQTSATSISSSSGATTGNATTSSSNTTGSHGSSSSTATSGGSGATSSSGSGATTATASASTTGASGSTTSSSGSTSGATTLPSYDDAYANWKNAGLLSVGGIPNRTTICATVNPLGGGQDDFTNIQNAINNCPAGEVVQLGAGAFTVHLADLPIQISTGIALRGTGRLRRHQLALLPDLHQRV